MVQVTSVSIIKISSEQPAIWRAQIQDLNPRVYPSDVDLN